jgi:voltage-gated potassium channel
MLMELLFVFCLVSVTVVVHAAGTFAAIAHLANSLRRQPKSHEFLASKLLILRVVGVLLFLHCFEAAIWATVYFGFGILPDFETSMYFSLTSYTTLGYGDVVLPPAWRLLGPFEAAVGILTFGWSTGVMVAAIARIFSRRLQYVQDEPQIKSDRPPDEPGALQ